MRLTRVTLAGADESVDPKELSALSAEFPFCEWGILLSEKRAGSPRYPGLDWLNELRTLYYCVVRLNLSCHTRRSESSAYATLLGR